MILKNLTNNYSTIPNELITDSSISSGAFRLYCYLASKPENWEINNADIMKSLKIGSNNSLSKYWKELIEAGWIEKQKEKEKNGKFTGKTILVLHNNQNRKNCENGEPKSQKNRNRKNCEIAKSATHNNTEYINKTEYIKEKNIKKEKSEEKQTTKQENKQQPSPISKKEANENKKTNNTQLTIQTLIEIIKEFFLKEEINFSYAKRVLFENKFKELKRNYSLEEIKKVIEFARDDLFYKKILPNPKSFFNSFESIKVAMQAERKNKQAYKEEQPEYVIDFYDMRLPEGWVL